MTYILNSAKTMRNLRLYAGALNQGPYIGMIQDSRVLQIMDVNGNPMSADLKPGATVYHDGLGLLATIQGGAGSQYVMDQPAPSTASRTRTGTRPTRPPRRAGTRAVCRAPTS